MLFITIKFVYTRFVKLKFNIHLRFIISLLYTFAHSATMYVCSLLINNFILGRLRKDNLLNASAEYNKIKHNEI